MSTVLPATEVALAQAVRGKGAAFVECPVGGSTGPARQGKLIGLMGGDAADVARARPILEQLCRRLEHAGPVGSGRGAQIRGQSAADGLLAGLGRGAGAGACAAGRSGAADGSAQRHLRRRHHRQSARTRHCRDAQGRRSRSGDLQRRRRHQGHAGDAGRSQIARHRAAARRQGARPATKKPSAAARAAPKSPPSRPIGRAAVSSRSFSANKSEPTCQPLRLRKPPPSSTSR